MISIKNKKALSGVIVTVILIGLAVVLGGIVWGVVNSTLSENIEQSSSCFGVFDEIQINDRYTCFDSGNQVVRFSITRGDIDLDGLVVSFSSTEKSEVFILNTTEGETSGLIYYSGGSSVKLPDKNAGTTYNYTWGLDDAPGDITIAPIIDGRQCGEADSLSDIADCSQLVN